jgi:hypothetical protein
MADSLILTFAAPEAVFVNGINLSWAKEIRRNLSLV